MTTQSPSVEAQLAVINTKLDAILATRDDHEFRIRKIEQFKWLVLGAALTSGPVFSTIASRVQ